jgi:hypothetical protein
MNEEEALGRLENIGQAFANDYNDGDGPDFEGFTIEQGEVTFLVYNATLENGIEVEFVWALEFFMERTNGVLSEG